MGEDNKMRETCNHCGKSYAACQYPVSHSHASINNVKLPTRVNSIMGRRDRTGSLTLQDRMTLNSIDILPLDFPVDLDSVI